MSLLPPIPRLPFWAFQDGQGNPDQATFVPAVQGSGQHAGIGPPPSLSAPGAVTLSCYAEPATNEATRGDSLSHVPLGKKTWGFFTPTDPGIGTDGFVFRKGQWFVVKSPPVPCGGEWRTEASQIS